MKFKTRFSSLEEFYNAIGDLVEWLKKDGHIGESQQLGTALVASATGSEILGDIWLALKRMKGGYSPGLRREIDECSAFARNHRRILGLDGG